ncbi:hypothetical protein ABG067_000004 [Albugo candida]
MKPTKQPTVPQPLLYRKGKIGVGSSIEGTKASIDGIGNEQLRTRSLDIDLFSTLTIDHEEKNIHPRNGMSIPASELEAIYEAILEEGEQTTGMGRLQAALEDREAEIVSLERQLNAQGRENSFS